MYHVSLETHCKCAWAVVQNYYISVNWDSGLCNEIVENEAPCTSAYTPQPQTIARTAGADTHTDWTDVDCIPDIALYSGLHGISWDENCEPVDFCLHVIDSEVICKNERRN